MKSVCQRHHLHRNLAEVPRLLPNQFTGIGGLDLSQAATVSPLPSTGRRKPRGSVAEQSVRKASMAGLRGTRLWVLVGPPLLAKVEARMLAKAVGVVPLEVAVI